MGANPQPSTTSTELSGYVPVPVLHPRDTGMRRNPDSAVAHVSAFRVVLLHLLTEAFDLREEEMLWTGYHLDSALAPLLDLSPHSVPFPVRQEMLVGSYSRLLALRAKAHLVRGGSTQDPKVSHAGVSEWADALMEPVISSYQLRPLTEATMRGQMVGLLRELGVGNSVAPRGATHLPTELRVRVFRDRSRPQ